MNTPDHSHLILPASRTALSRKGVRPRYDVVVVGSGLGGLLSAVILAKEGMKVLVLEKNKQAGGCLQTFAMHKKVFDSCVHYIGGLGEGHTLHRIFQYAGIMDKLTLKALDRDGFDRISFGGDTTEYPQAVGADHFMQQLLPHFPAEEQGLRDYVALVQKVTSHFPLYHLRMGSTGEKAAVTGLELTEALASVTQNGLLRQVLAGNNMLYAGVPGKTPFYLHALVMESYLHSAHKVVPGSSQIAKMLWRELVRHGGELIRHAEVTGLVEEGGLLQYAETGDGHRYFGRQFISAVHPAVTVDLVRSSLLRPVYRQRIRSLEQTLPAFMLNLVLQPGAVPYPASNLYWHAQADAFAAADKAAPWPSTYALYYTEDESRPGFADTVSVLTYMPYEQVARWSGTENHSGAPEHRGRDYEDFKTACSQRLLDVVAERLPGLPAHIIAQSAATPLTFRDYTATPEGALYGILKDVQQPARTTIATRTKIPNLLLTGQNVNLHGVLGVSITALATCAELLGMEYLLGKVNRV